MADPRAARRSRSGAHTPCPHCGKKLRHDKAVAMHIVDVHPELAPAPEQAPAEDANADPLYHAMLDAGIITELPTTEAALAEAPHGEPVEPRGAAR